MWIYAQLTDEIDNLQTHGIHFYLNSPLVHGQCCVGRQVLIETRFDKAVASVGWDKASSKYRFKKIPGQLC
jgi:hypothetical protein